MEYKTYEYEFNNRNDNHFKSCRICICPVPKGTLLTELEDTAKTFFSNCGCNTEESNVAQYVLKCPKENQTMACVFYPISNVRKDDTWKCKDEALRYMRSFNGIETCFDDYMRIQTEFKEQYEEL